MKNVDIADFPEWALDLAQTERQQEITSRGTAAWTILYDSWRYAALSIPEDRAKRISRPEWDTTIGHGHPGFSVSSDGTKYETYAESTGITPLVIMQTAQGVDNPVPLIDQELVLLMGVMLSPDDGNYYSFTQDGEPRLEIDVSGDRVRMRTPLLRRYQAARQLDLLLFTDSVQYSTLTWQDPEREAKTFDVQLSDQDSSILVIATGWGDKSFRGCCRLN